MSLDDRFSGARRDLDTMFTDTEVPPAGGVRRRHLRRRAVQATAGALALSALVVGAVAILSDDNDSEAIKAVDPPTTDAPVTTTTPTTATTSTTPGAGPASAIVPRGDVPAELVVARRDGALVRIRTADGSVIDELASSGSYDQDPDTEGPGPNVIDEIIFTADGRILYEECCEPAGGVIYEAGADKQTQETYFGYGSSVSPDGTKLAVVSGDGVIYIVDLATHDELHRIESDEFPNAVAWSPDGTTLAVAVQATDGDSGTGIAVVAVDAARIESAPVRSPEPGIRYQHPMYLSDGRLVVVASKQASDGNQPPARVLFLDPATGAETLIAAVPEGVFDLEVSAGDHLVMARGNFTLAWFDGTAWHEIPGEFAVADWDE